MAATGAGKFIRGGQTTQHWFRMAVQVGKYAVLAGTFVTLLSYGILIARNYELAKVQTAYGWWMARFAVENRGDPERLMRIRGLDGGFVQLPAARILADPEIAALYDRYDRNARRFFWLALLPGGGTFGVTIFLFWMAGRRIGRDEHIRGSRLIDQGELRRWTKAKWRAHNKAFGRPRRETSPYTIADIPFPPKCIEAQTGIFGTVGVGKTTAFKELILSIRAVGGRAVIYDRMGAYLRDFYDPERDIIVNPFDARSHVWSPFNEARTPEALAQIAEVMVPTRPEERDPFWSNTARLVFEYVGRKLLGQGRATNANLRDAILKLPAQDLEALLASSPGEHFVNAKMERTAANIRANMIAELRFLEFLRDDGQQFSIRDWVKNDDGKGGFVFLTGDAEHAAATRNIISALIEVASNALMTEEESFDPRLWFLVDELPSLNRMPFIVSQLAQIRQFGGAFVLGYQVYSQLEHVYGDKGAQSISGNLNNRIVFNTPDARTAKLFSESLGYKDLIEARENLTVGAHAARDGVGFVQNRTERPIVTASQIQALPQFQCYIRFAYDAPATQAEIRPKPTEPRAEKFIKYRGRGFALGTMKDAQAEPELSAFDRMPREEQVAEFNAWFDERVQESLFDDAPPDRMEDTLPERRRYWRHFVAQRRKGLKSEAIKRVMPDLTGWAGGPPAPATESWIDEVPPYPEELTDGTRANGAATAPSGNGPAPLPLFDHADKSPSIDAVESRHPPVHALPPETPLRKLPLSGPLIQVLRAAGIQTLGDLRAARPERLATLEGIDAKAIAMIWRTLAELPSDAGLEENGGSGSDVSETRRPRGPSALAQLDRMTGRT